MLNYTLDPYQRLYTPEAADTLWNALHNTQAFGAGTSSTPSTTLSPELAPLPPEGADRCSDREVALLGCVVAIYQAISDVFHTAVGVELAIIEGVCLPEKPTHAAIVHDVGRQVDELVRGAVIAKAWQLMYYSGLRNLMAAGSKEKSNGPMKVPGRRTGPGNTAGKNLNLDFHFGSPSPDMQKRYQMPNMGEPINQNREYLDSLKPNRAGITHVKWTRKEIRRRPYPEAVELISQRTQDAVRFAKELDARITDVFCTAARVELGLEATEEGEKIRHDLYDKLAELGQASAILYRQILEATPNLIAFKTMAQVKFMAGTGIFGQIRPARKRRR